jgi:hypothetical protein
MQYKNMLFENVSDFVSENGRACYDLIVTGSFSVSPTGFEPVTQ